MDLTAERASLREALNIRVSTESYILAFICAADMISTIVLVSSGKAIEANPILVPFMKAGIGWFLLAKSMFFLGPLFGLELLRSKRPIFVKKMLRVGIAAYLLSYGIGVIKVNSMQHAKESMIAQSNIQPQSAPITHSEAGSPP